MKILMPSPSRFHPAAPLCAPAPRPACRTAAAAAYRCRPGSLSAIHGPPERPLWPRRSGPQPCYPSPSDSQCSSLSGRTPAIALLTRFDSATRPGSKQQKPETTAAHRKASDLPRPSRFQVRAQSLPRPRCHSLRRISMPAIPREAGCPGRGRRVAWSRSSKGVALIISCLRAGTEDSPAAPYWR